MPGCSASFLQKDANGEIKGDTRVPEPVRRRPYLSAAALALLLFSIFLAGSFTDLGRQYLRTAGLFYRSYFTSGPSPDTIPSDRTQKEPLEAPKAKEQEEGKVSEKRIITVKPGDTLLGLAIETFSFADRRTLEWIQKENPEIEDANLIEVGQEVVFSKPPFLRNGFGPIYSLHVASFKQLKLAQSLFVRMIGEGHEAFILPLAHPQKGKVFRVAVGAFSAEVSAKRFGKKLIDMGVVDHAEVISIEVR